MTAVDIFKVQILFFALLNLVPNSAFEKQQQQQKRLALIKGLLIDAP